MRTQENQLDIVLYRRQGMSYREIARRVGCTPRTAKKYVEHPELIGKRRESSPRLPQTGETDHPVRRKVISDSDGK